MKSTNDENLMTKSLPCLPTKIQEEKENDGNKGEPISNLNTLPEEMEFKPSNSNNNSASANRLSSLSRPGARTQKIRDIIQQVNSYTRKDISSEERNEQIMHELLKCQIKTGEVVRVAD